LIDAGLSRKETQARLHSIGECLESIDAILITHEHSDHISGLPVLTRFLKKKPVYCTHLTGTVLDWEEIQAPKESFQAGTGFVIGDLEIASFTVPHDAIDPVGFTVRSQGVRCSIVTDLGYLPDSVRMHLRGTDLLLLEANHSLEMLKDGPYPWPVRQRIMGRKGHLSNDAAAEFISRHMDVSVSTLILGHISENTNYPSLVAQMADRSLRGRGLFRPQTYIAEPGKAMHAVTY
jgi:phosphoribosyl 1,2-cyclic phosphodiesterase